MTISDTPDPRHEERALSEREAVNHPAHYNTGKFEVIDVVNDWGLSFARGNALKYIARAGKKDPAKEIEDLEKARFYLALEIEHLKGQA